MRTVRYLSPLRKLCSKIDPVRTLRSLALITAPARASLMCSTLSMASSCPSISNMVPGRKSFVSITQVLHRGEVAPEAEAHDHALRRGRRQAAAAPGLVTRVEVRDVDFDHRDRERVEAVIERVGLVGESRGIQDHPGRPRGLPVQEIEQVALVVGLKKDQLAAELLGPGPKLGLQVGEGLAAVDIGFPYAQ